MGGTARIPGLDDSPHTTTVTTDLCHNTILYFCNLLVIINLLKLFVKSKLNIKKRPNGRSVSTLRQFENQSNQYGVPPKPSVLAPCPTSCSGGASGVVRAAALLVQERDLPPGEPLRCHAPPHAWVKLNYTKSFLQCPLPLLHYLLPLAYLSSLPLHQNHSHMLCSASSLEQSSLTHLIFFQIILYVRHKL